MAKRQRARRNKNAVTLWLDEDDYKRVTLLSECQGVSRKEIFTELLHNRYRKSFPLLAALSHVVAAALSLERDGVSDEQLTKLRQEVDKLAGLALDEVRGGGSTAE